MNDDIYRQLQQRLDLYSMGFPATDSGVEIEILKHLFSEKDADMFLALTPKLEEAPSVAERCEASVQQASAFRSQHQASRPLEQSPSALPFELVPAVVRALHQRDVEGGLEVRLPDHPGPTM